MAQGDAKAASAFVYKALNTALSVATWSFVTEAYSAINANASALNITDLTEVASAGNYTAKTALGSKTFTQSGASSALDGIDISVAASGSNPTTAKSIVFLDADNDVILAADLTTDGSTAVDMTQGFTDTFDASGLLVASVN